MPLKLAGQATFPVDAAGDVEAVADFGEGYVGLVLATPAGDAHPRVRVVHVERPAEVLFDLELTHAATAGGNVDTLSMGDGMVVISLPTDDRVSGYLGPAAAVLQWDGVELKEVGAWMELQPTAQPADWEGMFIYHLVRGPGRDVYLVSRNFDVAVRRLRVSTAGAISTIGTWGWVTRYRQGGAAGHPFESSPAWGSVAYVGGKLHVFRYLGGSDGFDRFGRLSFRPDGSGAVWQQLDSRPVGLAGPVGPVVVRAGSVEVDYHDYRDYTSPTDQLTRHVRVVGSKVTAADSGKVHPLIPFGPGGYADRHLGEVDVSGHSPSALPAGLAIQTRAPGGDALQGAIQVGLYGEDVYLTFTTVGYLVAVQWAALATGHIVLYGRDAGDGGTYSSHLYALRYVQANTITAGGQSKKGYFS